MAWFETLYSGACGFCEWQRYLMLLSVVRLFNATSIEVGLENWHRAHGCPTYFLGGLVSTDAALWTFCDVLDCILFMFSLVL